MYILELKEGKVYMIRVYPSRGRLSFNYPRNFPRIEDGALKVINYIQNI